MSSSENRVVHGALSCTEIRPGSLSAGCHARTADVVQRGPCQQLGLAMPRRSGGVGAEKPSFNHLDQKTVYDGIIEHWMGFNILIEHRGKKSPANSANMQLCIFFVWNSPLPFFITRWYIPNSFKHLLRLYLWFVFWVQTPSGKVFNRDMII